MRQRVGIPSAQRTRCIHDWRLRWQRTREIVQNAVEFVCEIPSFIRNIRDSIRDEKTAARNNEPVRLALAAKNNASAEQLVQAVEALCREEVMWFPRPSIKALAAHPNLPPDALLSLLKHFTRDAVEGASKNPILPLIPLEQPDFANRLSPDLVCSILNTTTLTPEFARLLLPHPNPLVQLSVRSTRAIAGAIEPDADWRAELYPQLRLLANQLSEEQQKLLHELAEIGLYSPEILPDSPDTRFIFPDEGIEAHINEKIPALCKQSMILRTLHRNPIFRLRKNQVFSLHAKMLFPPLLYAIPPYQVGFRSLVRLHPKATHELRSYCNRMAIQDAFNEPYGSCLARYGVLSHIPRIHKNCGTPGVWGLLINEDNYTFLEMLALTERMRLHRFGQFWPTLLLSDNNNRFVVAACAEQNATAVRFDRWLSSAMKRWRPPAKEIKE